MGMSVQEIRNYVRTSLDTDEEELPNDLIDVWITEGITYVQRQPSLLTYFQKSWSLSTTDGVQAYALSTIGDVDEILYVEAERWALKYRPHEVQVRRYAYSNLSQEPREYSIHAGNLYLWATPDDGYDIVVRGVRTPLDAPSIGAGAEPDVPVEFHQPIAEWVLARAYEQQDDDVMSERKFSRLDALVDRYSRKYRRAPRGLTVVGSDNEFGEFPQRLVYDWE